jgi:hypothetical protein
MNVKAKKRGSSHVQYMMRTRWNWIISHTAVWFATRLVSRSCEGLGIEGRLILKCVLNTNVSEKIMVFDSLFETVIDLRIP